MEDFDNYQSTTWTVERPLIPQRDSLSNKWLWLRPAMKGVKVYQDPFPPDVYWIDKKDYMILKLKGTI